MVTESEVKMRILELSTFSFNKQKAIIKLRSGNLVRKLSKLLHLKKIAVENVLIVKS